jgi:hypothetical protein
MHSRIINYHEMTTTKESLSIVILSVSLSQKELIQSEKDRRSKRLEDHYKNNVWKKRVEPPADWNKPLPERLIKEYENTYLYHRAKEMRENKSEELHRTMCVLS